MKSCLFLILLAFFSEQVFANTLANAYDDFTTESNHFDLIIKEVIIDDQNVSLSDIEVQFPSTPDYGCHAGPSTNGDTRFHFMVRALVNIPTVFSTLGLPTGTVDIGYFASSVKLDRDLILSHSVAPSEESIGIVEHQLTPLRQLNITYSSKLDPYGFSPTYPEIPLVGYSHTIVNYSFDFSEDLSSINKIRAVHQIFDLNEKIRHTLEILCLPPGPMS